MWTRGMDAVCVNDNFTKILGARYPSTEPRPLKGQVYRVTGVKMMFGHQGLQFAEFPQRRWFQSSMFRPVTPLGFFKSWFTKNKEPENA